VKICKGDLTVTVFHHPVWLRHLFINLTADVSLNVLLTADVSLNVLVAMCNRSAIVLDKM